MAAVCASMAAAALNAPTAAALPAVGERATIDVSYTTGTPGAAAGLAYRFQVHGEDPQALRRLVLRLPEGSVVDTSVPERCTASDEELRLRGDAACPSGSFLGVGTAELIVVGVGRQRFTQAAFNAADEQFQTVKQGDRVNAVVRGTLRDGELDATIPTCVTGGSPPERCPSDQARLLTSGLELPPFVKDGRSYLTMPPTCPASGRWRTTVSLTFADGVVERFEPEHPCERPTPERAAAACRSRRVVVLRALARVGLRSIVATVRGRRVRLDPRRPAVDLRGLPSGRYTVRFRATTKSGTRLAFVRRYRTCTA